MKHPENLFTPEFLIKARRMILCIAIAACLSMSGATVASAQVKFKIPIAYIDSIFMGGEDPSDTTGLTFITTFVDTIWFGIHDQATICRDTLSGFSTHWAPADTGTIIEEILPLPTPDGKDIRFVPFDAVQQGCFYDGSRADIRPYIGPAQQDSLRFRTMAKSYPTGLFHREVLRWPVALSLYFDSCRIRNIGGRPVNVEMTQTSETAMLLFSTDATFSHSFRIVASGPKSPPPSVTYSSVVKTGCVYVPISGGLPGPFGHNMTSRIGLPFLFNFNGYNYDSLQISTNGWVEFGTGAAGTPLGLSTPAQIGLNGSNENGRMGSGQCPTKALGVWWENMNTDAPGSAISYTTLGSPPNRSLVVEWKEMRAYYDSSSTTTLINFQLELEEGSNVIQYHYGPVTSGTFGGADAGAMIGMKDELGGDYHYFDIAAGGSGLAGDVTTNLLPLTNWPGPDSCYVIWTPSSFTYISYSPGWNLVSLPAVQPDLSVSSIFPSAVGGHTFGYADGKYRVEDSISPGTGYWTKLSSAEQIRFVGPPYSTAAISVAKGWNIIGSVDHDVPAPAGGIVSSRTFGYNGGYSATATLNPGRAYWVKCSEAGVLTLGTEASSKTFSENFNSYTSFTVIDKRGNQQTLYVAEDPGHSMQPDLYEMPPVPPGGFDVRFASQRLLEVVLDDRVHEFPITISAAEYPVRISWKMASTGASASLHIGKEVVAVAGEGSRMLVSGEARPSIHYRNGMTAPKEFSLAQNYPNPFNPSTTIAYTLPKISRVTLKVFNVLGQEVRTLVNKIQDAGYQSVEFDAGNLPSGVYLYRISAGEFTDVKKMVVLK